MATKNNTKIDIVRYDHPDQAWEGYVEPNDKSWIVYFADGEGLFFPQRDAKGSVVGEGVPSVQVSP